MKKAIKWALVGAAVVGAGAFIANRIVACKRKKADLHLCKCGHGDDCDCDGECQCGGECGGECECHCHDEQEPRVDVEAMPVEEATEEVVEEAPADTTPVE